MVWRLERGGVEVRRGGVEVTREWSRGYKGMGWKLGGLEFTGRLVLGAGGVAVKRGNSLTVMGRSM